MLKLNALGSTLLYSTYLGGNVVEFGNRIAVDSFGNACVTGATFSTDFPTNNAVQQVFGGGNGDAYVAKLNSNGSALIFSTYLGGSSDEQAFGIAVDSAGNVYVTGYTDSMNFPTASALQPSLGGFSDAFVTKLNPSWDHSSIQPISAGADSMRGTASRSTQPEPFTFVAIPRRLTFPRSIRSNHRLAMCRPAMCQS